MILRQHHGQRPIVRSGFTLVELLVVVAIIAMLLSILLPALQRARAVAKETACLANMKQIMLGMQLYTTDSRAFPDPTDTSAYNLHPSSDERRAARWHLFFNEYTGGEACNDSTYAAWKNFDTFGPVASKVWNGCPVVKKAQSMERYHYGIFTVGANDDGTVHTYPLFGLRPTNVRNASSAGIIGESNAFALDGGNIQGDTLFYMKDFGLGQRTGTSGFEAFQRHVRTGFNVGYLDGHVDFYAYPDLTWYRTIVYDIVNY